MPDRELVLPILGFIFAGGVAAFFIWERHDTAKAMIEGDLRFNHATDIKIEGDWFDFDRDTLTYDVEYTDASGKRRRNRCKVGLRVLSHQRVFWQDPLR